MKVDLASAEGARAWLLHCKKYATECFRCDGELRPAAVFIALRDPNTGKRADPPSELLCGLDPTIMNEWQSKDMLASWLRTTARRADAIGFALFTEAWMADYAAGRPRPEGPVEKMEGRKEIIMIQAQHRALGAKMHVMAREILRPKGSAPKLGSWSSSEAAVGESRFGGVIPDEKEVAERAAVLERLAAVGRQMSPAERRHHLDIVRRRLVAGGVPAAAMDAAAANIEALLEEIGVAVPPDPSGTPLGAPQTVQFFGDTPVTMVNLPDWVNRPPDDPEPGKDRR